MFGLENQMTLTSDSTNKIKTGQSKKYIQSSIKR